MTLHWVDYGIILIMGLSILTGLFRGFLKELVALGVWILAIGLGARYANTLTPFLMPYIQDAMIRELAGFVIILVAVVLAGGLCNALLSFILHRTGLNGTDRLLGGCFGLVRGIFIIALLIMVFNMTAFGQRQNLQHLSAFYGYFVPFSKWLASFTPDIIKTNYLIKP